MRLGPLESSVSLTTVLRVFVDVLVLLNGIEDCHDLRVGVPPAHHLDGGTTDAEPDQYFGCIWTRHHLSGSWRGADVRMTVLCFVSVAEYQNSLTLTESLMRQKV